MDVLGPYNNSIRQQQPGGAIIKNNFSITCMTMIDPATSWFEISEIPTYNLDEVAGSNDEYIDKLSARVIQLFNSTWLSRYPHSHKVVFDKRILF